MHLLDSLKDLDITLNKLQEDIEFKKSFTNEIIPALSAFIFNELKRALMLYNLLQDDNSKQEFKEKFTIVFHDLVSIYQAERDSQIENETILEKDLMSSLKATYVFFSTAIVNKVTDNEWILELMSEYPTVFMGLEALEKE